MVTVNEGCRFSISRGGFCEETHFILAVRRRSCLSIRKTNSPERKQIPYIQLEVKWRRQKVPGFSPAVCDRKSGDSHLTCGKFRTLTNMEKSG